MEVGSEEKNESYFFIRVDMSISIIYCGVGCVLGWVVGGVGRCGKVDGACG